jgi:hypothetical protein
VLLKTIKDPEIKLIPTSLHIFSELNNLAFFFYQETAGTPIIIMSLDDTAFLMLVVALKLGCFNFWFYKFSSVSVKGDFPFFN